MSHKLKRTIPVYGKVKESVLLKAVKSIAAGDSCRIYRVGVENHWGTHIDCPAHFFPKGKTVVDYEADFWFFRKPQVVSMKVLPGQMIDITDFKYDINVKTDLLILKTGWCEFRGQRVYSCQNPGISPNVGLWLRKKYPKVRAIGFDLISLSSFQHRNLGRNAHRVFLNPKGQGHPILIIEDMLIPEGLKKLESVWVVPIVIEGIDSAPCTVIGVVK